MTIIAVVHVDNTFPIGLQSRCNRFRAELNHLVPIKNLEELRCFGGCHYSRDRDRGTLTISQETFADELVRIFQLIFEQNVPLRVGVKLEKMLTRRR